MSRALAIGPRAADQALLETMALLDPTTENLLQEIALELAFAPTGGHQSVVTLLQALRQLQQLGQAQEAIENLVNWLAPLEASGEALAEGDLDNLQRQYLAVEKAVYAQAATSAIVAPSASDTVRSKAEPSAEPDDEAGGVSAEEPGLTITVESKDDLELLNEFCNEGRDLLSQVEQGVLVLEQQPEHRETLNQVFRAFHTFKGGAGFLGLDPIKELAHILESLLDAARQNILPIDRQVINLILAGGDTLRQFIDGIEQTIRSTDNNTPIIVPTLELIARVKATLAGQPEEPSPAMPEMPAAPAAATVTTAAAPRSNPEANSPGPKPNPNPSPTPNPDPDPSPNPKVTAEGLSNFVKIDTQKLDALIDLVGELVIAQSMVVEHPVLAQERSGDLPRHLRQLARISSDLQRNAMSLRMVPIRNTFQKMKRLVRDLASSQNKQVSLVLKGEDTELDRKIVEALAEPLIHMLRNSIDHGLEQADERLNLGKPAQGTIEVEASHQGGGILIRIDDDGRGIDPDKVLAKAKERGLIDAEFHGNKKEILSLIFQPGFSTAETVTDVSGRGVGMDVVRGSISRLRGSIDVESNVGKGTSFRIYLPLTLAIIDGMLVGVAKQRFILPTLSIQESFRPTRAMLSSVKGRGQIVNLRGNLIPLLQLGSRLGLQDGVQDPSEGIVLIINSGGQPRGVVVDRLISKQEVVIKALGDTFQSQPVFSGAAIMGDGQVALILDPDALGRAENHGPAMAISRKDSHSEGP
ncbi:chemotaxis protein CheA [Cyanobium sp. Maggiore-St4-Cus]|uniref:chemotaxis protein CheA n=1 Tax=Cyanobium sp. Maggiore-St4-Cus TaxID=2823717 RepID=UPI0020CC5EBA|nr:chemotaxis protein CheA [Cyanobium sp. Maggiore-St4-Cus]